MSVNTIEEMLGGNADADACNPYADPDAILYSNSEYAVADTDFCIRFMFLCLMCCSHPPKG